MWPFKKKKEVLEIKLELISTLANLKILLEKGGLHYYFSDVISSIILDLENNNIKSFEKKIRSIDMWGGAGALWEVHMENRKIMKEFELEIVKLIDLMDQIGWKSWRMGGIKKMLLEQ